MSFEIEYFQERVMRDIESRPVGALIDYARSAELLVEHGSSRELKLARKRMKEVSNG